MCLMPKENKRLSKKGFSLCPTIFELGYWSSPAFRLGLKLEITPLAFLVLKPLGFDGSYTIDFPGS